jgi:hypothetical protein
VKAWPLGKSGPIFLKCPRVTEQHPEHEHLDIDPVEDVYALEKKFQPNKGVFLDIKRQTNRQGKVESK